MSTDIPERHDPERPPAEVHTPERSASDEPRYGARTEPGETAHTTGSVTTLRDEVVTRERERFGGIKFGCAFFGWLAATGTVVLLSGVAAAIGAAFSASQGTTVDRAADAAAENGVLLGVIAAAVLALILLIGYFAGGYVAGRMARFDGAKQGFAVWLWAVLVAVIATVVTAISGAQWNVLGGLDGIPMLPISPETATLTGILTALGAAVVALIGAVLGGTAGMRFHRRVDREGLGR